MSESESSLNQSFEDIPVDTEPVPASPEINRYEREEFDPRDLKKEYFLPIFAFFIQ